MASVDILNVTKSFSTQQILHGINLSVKDGEFVALVGPSGCGKSTLLRLIAGLEEIGGGQIAIDGAVVNNLAPKDRDIAMVFQNYALYPHMTVRDNMAFSLKLRKMSEADIERQVASAANILGMTPYLRHFPRQLSGGQRQRVAMGRAIVRDPKVFLFDEPLSNLDARLRVDMRTEIKTLHQRLGSTSIYVTHDQIEAMTMADRIIVLTDGRVEQIGSPLELYDNPSNLTVAGFIGSPAMNFIPGVLHKNEDGVAVTLEGGVSLPLSEHTGGTDGQRVIYGVRPEHLQLSGSQGLPCNVSVVEPTGANTYVYANTAGTSICGMFAERHVLAPGETIWLQALPDKVHLFDAATGQAIPMQRRKAGAGQSTQAALISQYSDSTAA